MCGQSSTNPRKIQAFCRPLLFRCIPTCPVCGFRKKKLPKFGQSSVWSLAAHLCWWCNLISRNEFKMYLNQGVSDSAKRQNFEGKTTLFEKKGVDFEANESYSLTRSPHSYTPPTPHRTRGTFCQIRNGLQPPQPCDSTWAYQKKSGKRRAF